MLLLADCHTAEISQVEKKTVYSTIDGKSKALQRPKQLIYGNHSNYKEAMGAIMMC